MKIIVTDAPETKETITKEPTMKPLDKTSFLKNLASKRLLALNVAAALTYFIVIAFFFQVSNPVLFAILVASEFFHLLQVVGFVYTVWPRKATHRFDPKFNKPVDIFITVCGEPVSIVRKTVKAALAMNYAHKSIYLLNDGFVAKKSNWQAIEKLASDMGIGVITRKVGGGAKAGNINNAMRVTASPYIVIFDADHIPHRDFLTKTMGYFIDRRTGFVQTPQYYYNQNDNQVTRSAWSQQTLFFGPIMTGKDALNSAFMCGTNMVLSRHAINIAGGMREDSIAEDFLTSLYVHSKGFKSVYVPEVLAEGLAPEDFESYYKQQFRWSRGSLELVFKHNPLFKRGLTLAQRLQYVISSGFYLGGSVVAINALMPILFLFTGMVALSTNSMLLAMVFLPYIFLNLYTLQIATSYSYSFEAISFSLSQFWMQLKALKMIAVGQKSTFAVTSKTKVQGNFTRLVIPHIAYIAMAVAGLIYAIPRIGISASLLANVAWIVVNIVIFTPFIYAATSTSAPFSLRRVFRKITAIRLLPRTRNLEGGEA